MTFDEICERLRREYGESWRAALLWRYEELTVYLYNHRLDAQQPELQDEYQALREWLLEQIKRSLL